LLTSVPIVPVLQNDHCKLATLNSTRCRTEASGELARCGSDLDQLEAAHQVVYDVLFLPVYSLHYFVSALAPGHLSNSSYQLKKKEVVYEAKLGE